MNLIVSHLIVAFVATSATILCVDRYHRNKASKEIKAIGTALAKLFGWTVPWSTGAHILALVEYELFETETEAHALHTHNPLLFARLAGISSVHRVGRALIHNVVFKHSNYLKRWQDGKKMDINTIASLTAQTERSRQIIEDMRKNALETASSELAAIHTVSQNANKSMTVMGNLLVVEQEAIDKAAKVVADRDYPVVKMQAEVHGNRVDTLEPILEEAVILLEVGHEQPTRMAKFYQDHGTDPLIMRAITKAKALPPERKTGRGRR